MRRTVTAAQIAAIGAALRLRDPYAYATIVAAVHPVPEFPEDIVAVVRYRTPRGKGDGRYWALVQRVGPCWSVTLKLTAEDAARRALVAVGKDPDDQPAQAQMEGRTDGGSTANP